MTGGEHAVWCSRGSKEEIAGEPACRRNEPADGTSLQTEPACRRKEQTMATDSPSDVYWAPAMHNTAESTGHAAGNPAVCPHRAGLPEQLQIFL